MCQLWKWSYLRFNKVLFFFLLCHFYKFNLWISGLIQPVWRFIQHITNLPHSWSCSSNDSFQSCSLFSCPIVFPYQHFHISFEYHIVRTSWGLSGKGEMYVFHISRSAQSDHFQFCSKQTKANWIRNVLSHWNWSVWANSWKVCQQRRCYCAFFTSCH